ncbi:winged helix-turn-helix transcriptional regulator [Advenella mimigardefordensis]|uniref:Putative transcriptional regulator n=1 Tax=Advenella mimigardefordensis (strain DSM 17166 / LMG 22922 / DPN7) TaxID=1247726 RepID=W0PDS2_ADVMD|nr:helix-turn-helix domain-containing protein [Advenella mimigardefordensis]AHG63612.1 putative transcriptional regulator [Advenella mimigardefordensis DPN7]
MTIKASKAAASCPVETTLKVIGGRWKVLIIQFLLEQPRRFGELSRCLGSVSARSLSKQLRELEEDGLIVRTDFEEKSPKVEYSVSELGKEAEPILLAMAVLGEALESRAEKSSRTSKKK